MIVLQPSQFNLEQFGTKARLWLGFKSTHMLPPALLEPQGEIPLLLSHHAEAKGQEAAAEQMLNFHLFFSPPETYFCVWPCILRAQVLVVGTCWFSGGDGGLGADVPLAPWCNIAEILNM